MSALQDRPKLSPVIALHKVPFPSCHLLPTAATGGGSASSGLAVVGKLFLYHLPALRQVWSWLTFCVLFHPEVLQIPGLYPASSSGLPPVPEYHEATWQLKPLRSTFAFFQPQLVYKLCFALILGREFCPLVLREMQCVFKQDVGGSPETVKPMMKGK